MSNVQTTQEIYEAFGRGDVPAVLQHLAEDVRWEYQPKGNTAQEQDVPYMRSRRGRAAVEGFFQDVDADCEWHSFNPRAFLEGDSLVGTVFEYEFTVKPTGKRVSDEEIHLWEFDADGKVTSFRHFLDTAKAIEAHT